MNINKFKYLSITFFYLVISLLSGIQCAEEISNTERTDSYSNFLQEYNNISEDHQCFLRNQTHLHYAPLKISDESAKSIAFGIKNNTVITYLDLTYNCMTSEGIRYLTHALMGKPITQFHMHGGKIGDQGHILLAEAIKTWPITHLNVNSTDLSDAGAEALYNALKGKKLEGLWWEKENKLSEKGVICMLNIAANRY